MMGDSVVQVGQEVGTQDHHHHHHHGGQHHDQSHEDTNEDTRDGCSTAPNTSNEEPPSDAQSTPDLLDSAQQHQCQSQSSRPVLAASNKRRSSWRHLLSPSYKSRSEEFHKLFADELPKGERLIADYSCALHREILLQGRLYVSINYLAFYSNIFSWITKLVVRLSDIRDIYKANTAKIIPNAIQIITEQGEKHVFASFIARDKTYLMIWRIWRNSNLIKERLSDQEIRRLVHLSYGKDLGLNDLEEQKISGQPMSLSSSSSSHESQADDNNNRSEQEIQQQQQQQQQEQQIQNRQTKQKPTKLRFKSRSQSQKEVLSLIEEADDGGTTMTTTKTTTTKGHSRKGSLDFGRGPLIEVAAMGNIHKKPADRAAQKKALIRSGKQVESVLRRLPPLTTNDDDDEDVNVNEPREIPTERAANDPDQSPVSMASNLDNHQQQILNETGSSSMSSAVVVDTPILMSTSARYQACAQFDEAVAAVEEDRARLKQADFDEQHARGLAGQILVQAETDCVETADERQQSKPNEVSTTGPHLPELGMLSGETKQVSEGEMQPSVDLELSRQDEGATGCGCVNHEGIRIADEQFDIGVDILFSLIFTNSKFMRAHMVRRGMTSASVSKWRRGGHHQQQKQQQQGDASSTIGGDRSNSSTLSSRDSYSSQKQQQQHTSRPGRQNSVDSLQALNHQVGKVRSEQERQLSYSMNVNHVLAKQIQVEERQNICLAKPGLVYVLKSQTINSGFPCSESFTIDLTYCLTRCGSPDKSRMLVHGLVNFIKEKQSWRLSMIKSVIEKSSMQGIQDFIGDLTEGIRDYVINKAGGIKTGSSNGGGGGELKDKDDHLNVAAPACDDHNNLTTRPNHTHRGSRSLARAKSKLKERKLRNMYKYYIQTSHLDYGDDFDPSNNNNNNNNAHHDQRPLRGASQEMSLLANNDSSTPKRGGHLGYRLSDLEDTQLSCTDNTSSGSRSGRSSCSSMMSSAEASSSICDLNDNDSMVMMMAATNDDDDDDNELHLDQEQYNHHRSRAKTDIVGRMCQSQANNITPARATTTCNQFCKNHQTGASLPERRLTGANLIMVIIMGLFLLIVLVVTIMSTLILRRLERVESSLKLVQCGTGSGGPI